MKHQTVQQAKAHAETAYRRLVMAERAWRAAAVNQGGQAWADALAKVEPLTVRAKAAGLVWWDLCELGDMNALRPLVDALPRDAKPNGSRAFGRPTGGNEGDGQ